MWRLFQPTLDVQCFEADDRTRLETEMRVSKSGLGTPGLYALGYCLSLIVGAVGSVAVGFVIAGAYTAGLEFLRARARRGLSTDGPFLREQLTHLVHATEPAR